MTGILFALLTAVLKGTRDLISKRALKKAPVFAVLSLAYIAAFLISLPFSLSQPVPEINPMYWPIMIIAVGASVVGQALYLKSIQISEVSHVVPLITFSPIFTMLIAPFIVGEVPTLLGAVGVCSIVAGAYISNVQKSKDGDLLTPFKELFRHKGSQLMLIVALIWSVASVIEKVGIQLSAPLFWAMSMQFFIAVAFTIIAFARSSFKDLPRRYILLILLLGCLQGASYMSQAMAVSTTFVVYAIAIKRLSVLFTVVFGYLIFKESNFRQRLLGSVLMVLGVILIVLA